MIDSLPKIYMITTMEIPESTARECIEMIKNAFDFDGQWQENVREHLEDSGCSYNENTLGNLFMIAAKEYQNISV